MRSSLSPPYKLTQILCHIGGIIPAWCCRRSADAPQVNCYHRKLLRQSWHDGVILEPILRKPMNQDNCGTLAPADIVDFDPIHMASRDANPLPNPSGNGLDSRWACA